MIFVAIDDQFAALAVTIRPRLGLVKTRFLNGLL